MADAYAYPALIGTVAVQQTLLNATRSLTRVRFLGGAGSGNAGTTRNVTPTSLTLQPRARIAAARPAFSSLSPTSRKKTSPTHAARAAPVADRRIHFREMSRRVARTPRGWWPLSAPVTGHQFVVLLVLALPAYTAGLLLAGLQAEGETTVQESAATRNRHRRPSPTPVRAKTGRPC